ncbi:S-adenosyl-L-methionine-dependent methyltransferase [Obba rivulosa]|uniref:S-adenosyl-L-methionine-dependent methyltransferase n=1 Tax=Obba rivulosa TaxID=1052685 RepID=A0A8E2DT56_9APHY|nr:S-adenosyl-L-methionine-dependent methyltransferase [Obba rivulosa]
MNFYFEAAKLLDKLDAKKGSVKGVIASVSDKDRKRTAALVIETLKYKSVLSDVIDAAKLLKDERKITSKNLALVLVHDLLLSNGIQAGDGPIKQAILRHKTRLNGEFQKLKIKRGVQSTADLAQSEDARAARIPRYVRVNTAVWTTDKAVKEFLSRGFELTGPFESKKGFARDQHIPDLLLFPPHTQFTDDPLYTAGKIILQDKASCFPAYILAPPAADDSVVIDATAAPGNKTSHLSALMRNRGKLFAFERDRKRFSTLTKMLAKAHCRNVEPINADFLTVSPEDPKYKDVTHILLDPSCSGSGIVNRLDYLLDAETQDAEEDRQRLDKLASFQLLMIRHAMKFPSVKGIVYSTCSVHAIENEHVVRQALRTEEALSGGFKLAPRGQILPQWGRRGISEEMNCPADAQSVVRCSPTEDATNGFFVSLFVKADKSENNAENAAHASGPTDTLDKETTTVKRKERDTSEESSGPVETQRRRKKRKKKNHS